MSHSPKIVIVGGVAGGASCAARARRLSEDADITVFERGSDISFANCGMPYHIGQVIPDRERLLVQTPEAMKKRFGIEVRTRCEVTGIDRQNKQVHVKDLSSGESFSQPYDALVLSPGAEPVRPPIPGADADNVFTLRSLQDMDRIKHKVDSRHCHSALVVGGGYIGLEMAEALRQRDVQTTLVELAEQVFIAADPEMIEPIHQQLRLHGVDLRLATSITGIQSDGSKLSARLSNGDNLQTDMVILAVGVKPEVKLAQEAGLTIGSTGGIVVDSHMRTDDENIYAVGDAVEVRHFVGGRQALIPLAGPANRQGRIAAENILGRDSQYANSQGTAICKVFDLAVGMTGLSEKQIRKLQLSYEKVYVHPASHAGYYPGASQMSLKLIFDPETGKILGAQAVGASGVDKRIDVLAVAMRAGLTVQDLAELELSYAPPYGSAKDPVNYAGFVASNYLAGDMNLCHVEDVLHPSENQMLLDVRTPAEVEAGTIPGAKNIPIDELRNRISQLPRDKELLVFCQVGLRGYLATRILDQHGFKTRNLTGGYKTFKAATGLSPKDKPMTGEITDDTGEHSSQSDTRNDEDDSGLPAAEPKLIDARALQCPGPILRLKAEIDEAEPGSAVAILASDPGFPSDVQAWCHSTGHSLQKLQPEDGAFRAVVTKAKPTSQPSPSPQTQAQPGQKLKSIVVFSGDFDKAVASFIIANGAAAMGSQVTLFFTFWGLNILRRNRKVKVRKTLLEKMFGWMMPRGARKLKLSKMNMAGAGTAMIKGIMNKKNVPSLEELIDSARTAGVKLVACNMTMDLMGIKPEELIDGVEQGGVAMYLDTAEQGNVNLFI